MRVTATLTLTNPGLVPRVSPTVHRCRSKPANGHPRCACLGTTRQVTDGSAVRFSRLSGFGGVFVDAPTGGPFFDSVQDPRLFLSSLNRELRRFLVCPFYLLSISSLSLYLFHMLSRSNLTRMGARRGCSCSLRWASGRLAFPAFQGPPMGVTWCGWWAPGQLVRKTSNDAAGDRWCGEQDPLRASASFTCPELQITLTAQIRWQGCNNGPFTVRLPSSIW